MLPIAQTDNHLLMGVSPDTRPPPAEFAELFAQLAHVAHQVGKIDALDSRRVQSYVALANAAQTAQVFDFGELPEQRLMEEAKTGGMLMGQGLLRLPYPSVLYWYTLTRLLDTLVSKEKFYLRGTDALWRADRARYCTLVAEAAEQQFWVADFILLDPETAMQARRNLEATQSGSVLRELQRGRHFFLCSGMSLMSATPDSRWKGYLIDRPGEEGDSERDAASLGSLADGVAAMTMILSTRGIGIRREPAPAKLNLKRERLGKPPYPSVTHVDARQYFEAMRRTALGGTHASPVPHLRRGHVRTYEDGRRTWVRSCLVNCRSLEEAQSRDHYIVQTGEVHGHG